MQEWQSLSHVRRESKYHVVIMPKYHQRVLCGRLKWQIGLVLRELCRQRGLPRLIAPNGGFTMRSARLGGPS